MSHLGFDSGAVLGGALCAAYAAFSWPERQWPKATPSGGGVPGMPCLEAKGARLVAWPENAAVREGRLNAQISR